MTLLDLYEPIFQSVCMLNRVGRNSTGEELQFEGLRAQIQSVLAGIAERAEEDPQLSKQAKRMELPIIFFVDSMISESKLKLGAQWHKNRLAYERNELAGDEKFFDLLDETLAEQGAEATERLAVFYTCLGLGFAGWYAGQPEYLRKKMLQIAQRLPVEVIEVQQNARLCPEAYENIDKRNLVTPPGIKMAVIGIAFAGLCLVVFSVNIYLFRTASHGLAESLAEILRHDPAAK